MTLPNFRVERIGLGLILFIALPMAFEPLIRVHDPTEPESATPLTSPRE